MKSINKLLEREKAWQRSILSEGVSINTEKGLVEYARIGSGPVVMCLHGMPGGFDQGIFGFDWIYSAGFQVLAPSRPGYLGTPLSTGASYPEAADAFASLLDNLQIDKVSVVSISGGGPTAYQFAIRHPDRTNALVAIDSIAMKTAMPADFNSVSNALYFSTAGQKLLELSVKWLPKVVMKELIRSNSFLTKEEINEQLEVAIKDPSQLSMMLRIIHSMSNFSKRRLGVSNDIEQFTTMGSMSLESIVCPSLIVHGTHDNLLFHQAVEARDRIKNAEHLWVDKGSHFCAWIHPKAKDIQNQIIVFLKTRLMR